MAFTTEFVMGAGGAEVEEIPVSMSGSGGSSSSPVAYPLTTVDAGDGAIVLVLGTLDPGSTLAGSRPHLQIGSHTHESPHTELTGPAEFGFGVVVTGTVEVSILSRGNNTTSFTGTVYVARL